MDPHKTHIARLSNLAKSFPSPSSSPPNTEPDEEEDPEEIAYRERLRKLAEEDDDAMSLDPFGLDGGRAASSSAYADDKLSADAQRALDMLRRTSMAIADDDITSGRPSIWQDDGTEDDDEAIFKAQQARLKALTAAAQPGAASLRNQLTRAKMPKPPGLVDPEQQRRMQERQKRLSLAETAAVVAATGVSEDDVKEIKSHIDHVVKSKVAVADHRVLSPTARTSVGKPALLPPPGLGHALPPAPPPPPSFVAPVNGSKAPAITEMEIPQESKRSSMVEARKSSALPESRKSVHVAASPSTSPDRSPSRKSTATNLVASTSSDTVGGGSRSALPSISKSTSFSTSPASFQQEPCVNFLDTASLPRPLFDVLTWRTPVNALGWALFAIIFSAAAFSRNWSTLTVWAIAALLRISFLRATCFLESKLPSAFSKFVAVKDPSRQPGSFRFAGDVLSLIAAIIRAVAKEIGSNLVVSTGVLLGLMVVGFKLNLGITVAVLMLISSVILAMYKAAPQAFSPVLTGFPKLRASLEAL